jgi:hypothetical protein
MKTRWILAFAMFAFCSLGTHASVLPDAPSAAPRSLPTAVESSILIHNWDAEEHAAAVRDLAEETQPYHFRGRAKDLDPAHIFGRFPIAAQVLDGSQKHRITRLLLNNIDYSVSFHGLPKYLPPQVFLYATGWRGKVPQ